MASIIDHTHRVHIYDQPLPVLELVESFSPENTGSIVIPEGQRQWAWKDKKGLEKQQKLIDSVFYGYPIPSLILNKKRNKLEIYDGRHRIETLWRYFNNKFKWSDRLYSELCPEDQRIFCERTLPTTVTRNASNDQLADMFIRLNAGAPLKDYDLLWARRETNLVRAARQIVCRSERLSAALGGIDLDNRSDLANWVALTAGLSTWNPGNMTTSYIRLSGDANLGLNIAIDEEIVQEGVDAFCALLEAANGRYPVPDKKKSSLKKVGKIAAFFFCDWFEYEDKESVHDKWCDVIGRLRGNKETADAMSAALSTTGAQNLTNTKIQTTIAQVNAYLARGVVPTAIQDTTDDEED